MLKVFDNPKLATLQLSNLQSVAEGMMVKHNAEQTTMQLIDGVVQMSLEQAFVLRRE
jgi:hypothetical protein